jgi:hypothetical protein
MAPPFGTHRPGSVKTEARLNGSQTQLVEDRQQVQRPARVEQVGDVVHQVAQDLPVPGRGQQLRLDVARRRSLFAIQLSPTV